MYKYSLILATFLLTACASPEGSDWGVADFNKYDKNYLDFPTNKLVIGTDKDYLVKLLGEDFDTVEASSSYEVLAYPKWKSVYGPDYIEKTLYLRVEEGKLAKWKITSDTTAIVPRSW